VRCESVKNEHYKLAADDTDLRILQIYEERFPNLQSLIVNDVENDKIAEPFRRSVLNKFQIFSLFYIPITYEEKTARIARRLSMRFAR